jgi:acetyl esterase/lipase
VIAALALAAAQAVSPPPPASPLPPRAAGEQTLVTDFQAVPNVVYATAGGTELRLDVYKPRRAPGPVPTAVLYHGGGWVAGSKEASVLWAVPWLESGFAVVNVHYRLGRQDRAPAAVEDALCALRWVFANAATHGFDPSRIVTTGDSAGGHLALAAAFIPSSAGLARGCAIAGPGVTWASPPPPFDPAVAAVVNWYGITDVADLLDGPHARQYAIEWLGAAPDRAEIARRVSPLTYVRAGLPPVLTVHGDADTVVPYAHAVRLHDALEKAGVTHRLVTIPGGAHGGFERAQLATIAAETRAFLERVLRRR